MAKRKKPPRQYLTAQASWRRELIRDIRRFDVVGDNLGATQAERRLLLREDYLKTAIKDLRHYTNAYTPSKGFDLNKLAYIPTAKIARIEHDIVVLRQQLAVARVDEKGNRVPLYQVIRPRSQKSKDALTQFTGQNGDISGRTAFLVPKSDPRQKVSLQRKIVTLTDSRGRKYKSQQVNIELIQKRGKMVIYERYFRFPEVPITFDDVILMTRKMLRFMPRGWYVIETSTHGSIYAPIRKELILTELQSRFLVYDVVTPQGRDSRGLAETVVGYRLIGMHAEDADRYDIERLGNMEKMRQFRMVQRAKRSRQVTQRMRRWGF